MKRWINQVGFFVSCLFLFWSSGAGAADAISKTDAKAIHITVQSQLNAFLNDDAISAFELATSSTRAQIGTPDRFLRLVKEQYGAIYRHRVAIFTKPEVVDGNTIQTVRLTDRDGLVWVALYKMRREPDGKWKIDGCQLFGTTSVSV